MTLSWDGTADPRFPLGMAACPGPGFPVRCPCRGRKALSRCFGQGGLVSLWAPGRGSWAAWRKLLRLQRSGELGLALHGPGAQSA